MTKIPKPKPKKPISSPPRNSDNELLTPKPYEFISFPKERPNLKPPAGHHKYDPKLLHGRLFLTLTVKTSLHVSTGIVAMGSDIGSRVSLIKTMVQGTNNQLLIQGSSLKGCIRSVYEAITRSCICKTKANWKNIPNDYGECKIDRRRNRVSVCDTCRVFGAMDWQGLIEFSDSKCKNLGFDTGFMPSLYSPNPIFKEKGTKIKHLNRRYFNLADKVLGRKFYYHTIRAIEKGQNQGISVQQAAKQYTFTTELQFKNLKPEELGTLFIILGQDPKYPIALKVGGGKPIGMGTMTVEITTAQILQDKKELRSRYSSYTPPQTDLSGDRLKQFIQKQIQTTPKLVQISQLQELAKVLRYPTDREPPEGMY